MIATVLWDVYGECRNYGVLSGHKNAVLEVQWTYDSAQLVSASADKTVGLWDAQVRVVRQLSSLRSVLAI